MLTHDIPLEANTFQESSKSLSKCGDKGNEAHHALSMAVLVVAASDLGKASWGLERHREGAGEAAASCWWCGT